MNQYFTNNDNLKSQLRTLNYTTPHNTYTFLSDNGVFSKNKIDYGSHLLLDTYLQNKKPISNFLDVGCGYGFLSIVLSKELNIPGLGLDINKRALKLAQKNAQANQSPVTFIESNIYENIHSKFDLIITNPPIRAGKSIVLKILTEAYNYLNNDGELWFVVHKDQGAKSLYNYLKSTYQIDIITKNKGFYIFLAKKN